MVDVSLIWSSTERNGNLMEGEWNWNWKMLGEICEITLVVICRKYNRALPTWSPSFL